MQFKSQQRQGLKSHTVEYRSYRPSHSDCLLQRLVQARHELRARQDGHAGSNRSSARLVLQSHRPNLAWGWSKEDDSCCLHLGCKVLPGAKWAAVSESCEWGAARRKVRIAHLVLGEETVARVHHRHLVLLAYCDDRFTVIATGGQVTVSAREPDRSSDKEGRACAGPDKGKLTC